ncbi:MAG: hypothetical protein JWQ25_330 [Daejeonella sp.]|nr:hypothetical protein [Daejeonella sp.]
MKLQKIVSLANKVCEIQFLAMERSLRATGCELPIWVIPYDNNKFELPDNCIWWEMPEIVNWVTENNLWPAFKKIQCLTISNYQYVDSDVIFLKNPALTLIPFEGFVTSCTHWNNPGHTYTSETLQFLKQKSTTWPKLVFNTGQWACDEQLYETEELISFCENNFVDTLFKNNYLYKDQAGINLLVNYKNVPITNVTLPPINMESSWAGDYLDAESFNKFEASEKPYLMHWAGTPVVNCQYINRYFFKFLNEVETSMVLKSIVKRKSIPEIVRAKVKKTYHFIKTF